MAIFFSVIWFYLFLTIVFVASGWSRKREVHATNGKKLVIRRRKNTIILKMSFTIFNMMSTFVRSTANDWSFGLLKKKKF